MLGGGGGSHRWGCGTRDSAPRIEQNVADTFYLKIKRLVLSSRVLSPHVVEDVPYVRKRLPFTLSDYRDVKASRNIAAHGSHIAYSFLLSFLFVSLSFSVSDLDAFNYNKSVFSLKPKHVLRWYKRLPERVARSPNSSYSRKVCQY